MADATAAYSSVGVLEQLQCFLFRIRCARIAQEIDLGVSRRRSWHGRLRARARSLSQTPPIPEQETVVDWFRSNDLRKCEKLESERGWVRISTFAIAARIQVMSIDSCALRIWFVRSMARAFSGWRFSNCVCNSVSWLRIDTNNIWCNTGIRSSCLFT